MAAGCDSFLKDQAFERLKQLYKTGQISEEDYDSIFELSDPQTLDDLRQRRLISRAEFKDWTEIFESMEFTPKERGREFSLEGKKYLLFEAHMHRGQSFFIRELHHRRPIAYIEFTLLKEENSLVVFMIKVRKGWRGLGLQKFLFEETIRRNPEVRGIYATLAELNREILLSGLKNGKSLEEALKNTPAYKSRMKLGFTEMELTLEEANVSETFWHRSKRVYFLKARRKL